MPLSVDEYLTQKKPLGVDEFIASKQEPEFMPAHEPFDPSQRDITGTGIHTGRIPQPGTLAEPAPLSSLIPKLTLETAPILTPAERFAANIPGGLAGLALDMPQFIGKVLAEPEILSPVSKDLELQAPPLLKEIVDPAAKLAAALTVAGESPQADKFAAETIEEATEIPVATLMPLLVAFGARSLPKAVSKRLGAVGEGFKAELLKGKEPILGDTGPRAKTQLLDIELAERPEPRPIPTLEKALTKPKKEVPVEIKPEKPVPTKPIEPEAVKPVPVVEKPKPVVAKDVVNLRAIIKEQNQQGAKWRLKKNPNYKKPTVTGIDNDPFILTGTDLKGRAGQKIKGNQEFIIKTIEQPKPVIAKEAKGAPPPKEPPDITKLKSETGAVINPIAEVSKLTSEMIEKAKTPPEIKAGVKEAKESMIEHDRQIRRSESTSKIMERTFEKNVSDKARQELILHAVEQEHNPKYYNKLNEFEKGIVRWLDGELDKLDKFVKENDVVDLMPKEKGIRHIFHWWNDPKTGQPFASKFGKFSKGLPQAKQRVIPTYEKGLELGFKPVTTNIGKIIGETWQSVMRAQQSREMMKTLYHIGAEEGVEIQLAKGRPTKPVRMIERWDLLSKQGITEGYTRYDNPVLDKAITFKSGDRLVTIKGAVGVRNELLPFVKAYIENPTYGKLSQLNFAAKSMKLGLSLFHVQSLAMQELANFRIPYKNIPRGLRLRKNLPPEMRLLHQEGLDLWKGYEDVGYQNKFFTGKTKLGKVGNIATKPIEMMRSFIFDVVQPGMKASFAYDKFVKGLPKALKEGLTEQQWAREVVKMADGHFSHEHWKRSLLETNKWMVRAYFDPQSRKAWQGALLSPTWQREHMLVAKNVAKSFMPDKLIKKLGLEDISKTAKAQYRKYMLGAIMMVAAVDLYNLSSTKSMDGEYKHIWQNPPGKGFAVRAPWNEPSYKTESGKTIKGGKAYIRPLKSIYEVAEWGKDPLQKFIYKLSPALSAIGQQFWPGEYRHYEKGWPGYPERGKDLATDLLLPISFGQAAQVAKGKRDPLAAVFPFFGMPTSKVIDKKRTMKFREE